MILALSVDEIRKVCADCPDYAAESDSCQSELPPRPIISVRRCKNWDDYYHSACIFRIIESE